MFGRTEPFEACVFSYSLSMIPDWRKALSAASQSLSAAGRIHVVDFGDLEGLGEIPRRLMLDWLGLFHVAPRVELLQSFEKAGEASLEVLPLRYAFLLVADRCRF